MMRVLRCAAFGLKVTTPRTALKTTHRQWNELSPDVTRQIRNFRPIHPTALLIKDLAFTRLPEENPPGGVYWPARLLVASAGAPVIHVEFRRRLLGDPRHTWGDSRRHYTLSDFGDSEYDRYQIDSDRASGIRLGRVAGTERWGHNA